MSDPTPTEAMVLRWWSELLPTAPTSVDDDFFDLGGESMHLVRFLQRVYDTYGWELPVTELFAEPFTAARTAALLDG